MFYKIFSGILILSFLLGCSEQSSQTLVQENASETKGTVVASKEGDQSEIPTYLVATEAGYPPYEFRDENGKVMGYDVDILEAVAKDQGFKVKFLHQKWDGIFDTLNKGDRDIVAAAVGYTEERAENFTLSDPYVIAPSLIVWLDKNLDIKKFDDLKNLTVATQEGTTYFKNMEKLKEGTQKIKGTATFYLALKELMAGKVQAVSGGAASLRYYMKSEENVPFRTLEYSQTAELPKMVFVMKKGNTALAEKINAGLAHIKTSGEYEAINQKWFGVRKNTDQEMQSGN